MKVILKNVRLSFPNLFTPQSVNDSEAKFNAVFLTEAGSENVKAIETAIEAVAKDKWADLTDTVLKELRAADKVCLHNGNEKDYEGYAGMLYLSASSSTRPPAGFG